MNLAVRRRLADLRAVLFWGANSPSRKRQVQKNRDEVRKNVEAATRSAYKCKIPPQNTKKALQNARLMELITRFELVTSSLPNETNYLNI